MLHITFRYHKLMFLPRTYAFSITLWTSTAAVPMAIWPRYTHSLGVLERHWTGMGSSALGLSRRQLSTLKFSFFKPKSASFTPTIRAVPPRRPCGSSGRRVRALSVARAGLGFRSSLMSSITIRVKLTIRVERITIPSNVERVGVGSLEESVKS